MLSNFTLHLIISDLNKETYFTVPKLQFFLEFLQALVMQGIYH